MDFKSASADPAIGAFLCNEIPWLIVAAYTQGKAPYYVTQRLAGTYDVVIFIRYINASSDMIEYKPVAVSQCVVCRCIVRPNKRNEDMAVLLARKLSGTL